ncbi:MAG: VWA domain-containing protein [Verrucomicrobiota bacterium]
MNGLVFQWPLALLLLLGLLPLVRMLRHARLQREDVVTQLGGHVDTFRKTKDRVRLLALALILLALARPGVDPQRLSVANVGRDVVFVLDVSQSMLAEDASPSRLEVSKQGIRDALASFRSARAGLVIYAGSANILCPLTYDYDFVRYMLEQVTPRSVDFGGTEFMSAVEKTVDQVFSPGRAGFQDMVLLTDGEDHTGKYENIAERLNSANAGLLIVGVGDADRGARVPQALEDGQQGWLEYEGQQVRTKLNRESLQQLEQVYRDAKYVEVGTSAFDLGGLYFKFAKDRPSGGSDNVGDTIVVYREVGFLFLFAGVLIFLLVELKPIQSWKVRLAVCLLWVVNAEQGWAQISQEQDRDSDKQLFTGETFEAQTRELLKWQQAGKFEQVLLGFEQIRKTYNDIEGRELAVLYFNQGLCHLQLASKQERISLALALADTQAAQNAFLVASQLNPDFLRAGKRLDAVNARIQSYRLRIEEEARLQDELQERVEALLSKLEQLALAQNALKDEIPQFIRKKLQTADGAASQTVITGKASGWPERQERLSAEGKEVETEFAALDQAMSVDVPGMPKIASAFAEPLQLMQQAVVAQSTGEAYLPTRSDWPLARRDLGKAVHLMNEIILMLADQNTAEAEDADQQGDMDENWDMYEEGMFDETQASSMPMTGDTAQTSEMQPLPKPNYSAEDILGEEVENQQFRQQKRAASQAGQVERDW